MATMEETQKEPEKKESVPEREERILQFWNDKQIFAKSLSATEGKPAYIFYDGPPFATGLPHHGHLLQGTIKDVIPRYQTMRGRYVRREWGWDCHGLPIENLIEKELGFKTKQDIEDYGIEAFNQKAKESVFTYDKEWKSVVPRMGRFVDMEHAYKTMDASYTESIWWAFKTLYDKKLIYEGYKAMQICPRCETTLAASEVALGYKDVKDISVYVKFELSDEPNTFLIAWTTTPWTLPGNVAVAVNENLNYVYVEISPQASDGPEPDRTPEYFIVIEESRLTFVLEKIKGFDGVVIKTVKGKDLIGKSYKPIFPYYANDEKLENHKNGWKVVAADFVTTDSGTGIVHIAPAFGESDMEVGKEMKLPFIQHVSMDGTMKPEVVDFAGMFVKPKSDDDKERLATDITVLKYLQEHGHFFAKENIVHSYPHCWRCDWPLLNYATSSWFVDVTRLKPRLIEENKEISWVPENTKDGRFGKWLEGARDWAISRTRYWGAPLPVWKCNKCAQVASIGSIEELRSHTKSTNSYFVMRHGEAENNVQGIVSYKLEDVYHLTEKGMTQVKTAATKIKNEGIDLIISSPIMRTKETALAVAETLGLSADAVIFDTRITEVNTGDFNGSNIDEYRSYFTSTLEKFSKPSPNGENLEQMKARIGEFLYEIDQKYKGKKILLVAHEYTLWLMDAVHFGSTPKEAVQLRDNEGEDYIKNAEIREFPFAPIPHNHAYELDFHRPYIDDVSYHCTCELGTMQRIPHVFDCWFESGSMPFAQFHYMGDERTPEGKLFVKNFPADFIAEAVDQTRGWFYTMLILSVALFDRAAYKSVITTGLILAEDGQKMSKKLKNFPDPIEIANKFGADALRFYMINSPVVRGEELRFSALGVDEIFKKVTLRIDNVRSFFAMYAKGSLVYREAPKPKHILDRYIVARWYEMHAEVTHHLDTHELDRAVRPIMPFLDDLSTWYIRRSRDRFKNNDETDRNDAITTTGWVLFQLARLIAPIMPFLAEDIYQQLNIDDKKESVHLESWPETGVAASNILEEMESARRIVTQALEIRAKAGIKIRQPLARLIAPKISPELSAIIADEVNVKEVVVGDEIILDTAITPELKQEGDVRDIIRLVQEERKKNNFIPEDRGAVILTATSSTISSVQKHEEVFKKTVGAVSVVYNEGETSVAITKI